MGRNEYSSLLFAQPSRLSGFGSVIDLAGTPDHYNTSPTDEEADRMAILSDWYAVGADLEAAMRSYEEEHRAELNGTN